MKKNNFKKIFSAIAVLAISATAASVPLSACNSEKSLSPKGKTFSKNVVELSTALGTVRSETGKVYYVAPSGSAQNDGSLDHPLSVGSLLKEEDVVLQPGDTVYFLPGTYIVPNKLRTTASGEYNKYIRFVNAALDSASGYTGAEKEVTLDFSSCAFVSTNRGVELYGNYNYWYGIDICGAGDNGLYVGGSFITVENSEFYNNRDTGLQIGRKFSEDTSIEDWPSYNLIKNCTSHNNYDNETYGENADGFAAKLTVGYGNVFDGCIAYRNSDDGWDLYAKTDSGNIGCIIMYNCVAFENGYLEYTQQQFNKLFPTWNGDFTEAVNELDAQDKTGDNFYGKAVYTTRDGDGNGFKLGGSKMEGDVILENCLSFNNRMHGVTDNSNPGYIYVNGVTSYNNSAAIEGNYFVQVQKTDADGNKVNNKKGEPFMIDTDQVNPNAGQIIDKNNTDSHNNIDVARQTYSYNTVKNTLSVTDGYAKSLGNDAFRGSVTDSILLGGSNKQYAIGGSVEADTHNASNLSGYAQDRFASTAAFEKLPFTKEGDVYTRNVEVKEDLGAYTYTATGTVGEHSVYSATLAKNANRAHNKYRNADRSINMHDILAKKADLSVKASIGSTLNKANWGEYQHFYSSDLVNTAAASAAQANVARVKEALTIPTDTSAVYQDFDIPAKMNGCTITWASSDKEVLVIDETAQTSVSGSEYYKAVIYRDAAADKTVTLTATLTSTVSGATVTETKPFELTVKQGDPSLGAAYVTTPYGEVVGNGGSIIIDQYTVYREPALHVKNGLYTDSDKLLKEDLYTDEVTYMYAEDLASTAVQVKGFTPSKEGVYTIIHKITLGSQTSTLTYVVYNACSTANVSFLGGGASVSVNRDGFVIEGSLSSATGYLYAVSSATQIEVTKDNIKTLAGENGKYEFRATAIREQFKNANSAAYYIYYALGNLNGEITSDIVEVPVSFKPIATPNDLQTLVTTGKLNDENVATSIYSITADLDMAEITSFNGKNTQAFTGLLNGNGHTVSNISATNYIFYRVDGGTIMNVKFNNTIISGSAQEAALVSKTSGGYFHNIQFNNVKVDSTVQRVAALIGLVGNNGGVTSPLEITNVAINNSAEYFIRSTANRVGGFIGYVQAYGNDIIFRNCYVKTDISASSEAGGMIASWEDIETDRLIIENCVYDGTMTLGNSTRGGGMLGYHKGGVGRLEVTGCLSLAKYVVNGATITSSLKNCSPIIGNYVANGNVSVTACVGLMEEHNSDYDSTSYSEMHLQNNTGNVFTDILKLDTETAWTLIEDEERDGYYKAPYVSLNFLG